MNWNIGFAFGPAISILSAIIGGGIVGMYLHRVVMPKLKHIEILTNSTHSAALKRIDQLETEIIDLKKLVEPRL